MVMALIEVMGLPGCAPPRTYGSVLPKEDKGLIWSGNVESAKAHDAVITDKQSENC
jgi:hypothetical protein